MAKENDDLPDLTTFVAPGKFDKYDDQLTKIMVSLNATGAFLMVFGEEDQNGTSLVAENAEAYLWLRAHLPGFLRKMAAAIDAANQALIASAKASSREGKN